MTNPKRIHALNAHFKNWQTLQQIPKMRLRAELLELRQRWTQRYDSSLIIPDVAGSVEKKKRDAGKLPVILEFFHVSDERWHHRLRHRILSKGVSDCQFTFRTGERMECAMGIPSLSLFQRTPQKTAERATVAPIKLNLANSSGRKTINIIASMQSVNAAMSLHPHCNPMSCYGANHRE